MRTEPLKIERDMCPFKTEQLSEFKLQIGCWLLNNMQQYRLPLATRAWVIAMVTTEKGTAVKKANHYQTATHSLEFTESFSGHGGK